MRLLIQPFLLEHHGQSANMLKVGSKRRRTRKQIEKDEEAKLAEENANRAARARVQQVENELEQTQQAALELQQQAAVNKDASILLSDLVNAGIVKQKGPSSFVVQGAQGELNFDYENI